jgi:hypothetical protein
VQLEKSSCTEAVGSLLESVELVAWTKVAHAVCQRVASEQGYGGRDSSWPAEGYAPPQSQLSYVQAEALASGLPLVAMK